MKEKVLLGATAVLFLLAPLSLPDDSFPSNELGVKEILIGTYGRDVALRGQELIRFQELPDDEIPIISRSVRLLAEAGFPAEYSLDYLRLAGGLVRAGIALKDLELKIREGLTKEVAPERLMAVLDRRTGALKEARALVLQLVSEDVEFLDRQMAYTVFADYLLRGVGREELRSGIMEGKPDEYPAIDNLIR